MSKSDRMSIPRIPSGGGSVRNHWSFLNEAGENAAYASLDDLFLDSPISLHLLETICREYTWPPLAIMKVQISSDVASGYMKMQIESSS